MNKNAIILIVGGIGAYYFLTKDTTATQSGIIGDGGGSTGTPLVNFAFPESVFPSLSDSSTKKELSTSSNYVLSSPSGVIDTFSGSELISLGKGNPVTKKSISADTTYKIEDFNIHYATGSESANAFLNSTSQKFREKYNEAVKTYKAPENPELIAVSKKKVKVS